MRGKFGAVIQLQSLGAQQISRKVWVVGAIYSPEPQALLASLQETQSLFELSHSLIERRGDVINGENPILARKPGANPPRELPGLVLFKATQILVPMANGLLVSVSAAIAIQRLSWD